MKVAIIDSGIYDHDFLKEMNWNGFIIEKKDNKINLKISKKYADDIGHGTAITSIIYSENKNAEYNIFKVFDKKNSTQVEDLIYTLNYIYNCLDVDIIHISSGCTACPYEQQLELHEICTKLTDNNVTIVSAFDNTGVISYPAAFKNVIGVDWSVSCTKPKDYVFMDNSIVNILGIGSDQRLPWIDNTYRYVSGSSFAAPYITAIIGDIVGTKRVSYIDVLKELKKRTIKHVSLTQSKPCSKPAEIKRAIAFPFNKEIHSLALSQNKLKFVLTGIYDHKLSRNINKSTTEILNDVNCIDIVIGNFETINWEANFDTLILGHTDKLSKVVKIDFIKLFLQLCLKHKKNIYCFDDISNYEEYSEFSKQGLCAFFPRFTLNNVPNHQYNKMYHLATPVVSVFGTSPKQGKFTLQLKMKNIFKKMGYKVGHFSTEPNGYLLGSDVVYPVGYNSSVEVNGSNSILAINMLMKEIEKTQPDLIISGSQSHTVPYNTGNIRHYPLSAQDVLLGCEPDACILCVNSFDEIEYISRTINYLESYIETKVLALCVFPVYKQRIFSLDGNHTRVMNKSELDDIKRIFQSSLKRNTFLLGNESDEYNLCKICIDYFTEE